ncbi:MAG: MerR family transcriptional regulator [Anaerolineales bacterium]|nr:MerR family transcriptional regulator [Anaerolineales bacterium]
MPQDFLRTSDIAKAVGVHPNTVRLYEQWGYLPAIPRSSSGYRMFTEEHQEQMRLAWLALKYPYPGGKRVVLDLVIAASKGDLGRALELAYDYLAQIRAEQAQTDAATVYLERWVEGAAPERLEHPLRIGETARLLDLTEHMLRNWERDGLIAVGRNPDNGYRQYTGADIGRLRVIRTLRKAGYSTMAILRMIYQLDGGDATNLRVALDTPGPNEDIVTVADAWMSTLAAQEQRALDVIAQLERMIADKGG